MVDLWESFDTRSIMKGPTVGCGEWYSGPTMHPLIITTVKLATIKTAKECRCLSILILTTSFIPEGIDRIKPGSFPCRIETKNDPHAGRHYH